MAGEVKSIVRIMVCGKRLAWRDDYGGNPEGVRTGNVDLIVEKKNGRRLMESMYHVINRGNYRYDVFGSVEAAKAFETVLIEATAMFGWLLHAYVLMRNHFHLAVETPEPNLVEGMHWLQCTYATRYNRYRGELGHLFQGRYKALLMENDGVLARVVDYIHLNPVRASVVSPDRAHEFRWSSLGVLARPAPERPTVVSARWMHALGIDDTPLSLRDYRSHLEATFAAMDHEQERRELCRGWAIGTSGWKRALAKDRQALALHPGLAAEEIRDLRVARWDDCLDKQLAECGRTAADLHAGPKGAAWKCALAHSIRAQTGAPHRWLAAALKMGSAESIRSLLSRYHNQQFPS